MGYDRGVSKVHYHAIFQWSMKETFLRSFKLARYQIPIWFGKRCPILTKVDRVLLNSWLKKKKKFQISLLEMNFSHYFWLVIKKVKILNKKTAFQRQFYHGSKSLLWKNNKPKWQHSNPQTCSLADNMLIFIPPATNFKRNGEGNLLK